MCTILMCIVVVVVVVVFQHFLPGQNLLNFNGESAYHFIQESIIEFGKELHLKLQINLWYCLSNIIFLSTNMVLFLPLNLEFYSEVFFHYISIAHILVKFPLKVYFNAFGISVSSSLLVCRNPVSCVDLVFFNLAELISSRKFLYQVFCAFYIHLSVSVFLPCFTGINGEMDK